MGTKRLLRENSFLGFTTKKTKHIITRFSQLLFLVSIFVFLTGHEVSNPKIGKSIVDFYLDDITSFIQTRSSELLINSLTDSTGNIEDYVNIITAGFYEKRSFRPVWTFNFNTTANFDTLICFVDSLDYLGIPSGYINSGHLISLKEKLSKYKDNEGLKYRIALEMYATRIFFKSLIITQKGIFPYDTSAKFIQYINQLPDLAATSIEKHSMSRLFFNNQPQILPYIKLVNALPPFINNRRIIHTIHKDSLTNNERLLATTLYNAGILKSAYFDSVFTVEQSIKLLQKSSGLKQTGKLDSITHRKLIASIDNRFNQVCLNLDRLRKLDYQDTDYLFVNIPSFKLWMVKNRKTENSFKVIVGKKSSPTPVLSSKISKIVANPFWTVPKSITQNEMLYKIRKDSSFLQRNGYMIINNREEKVDETMIDWTLNDPLGNQYWIRQKYGRGNALGLVKFLFPNKNRIYLHDTPGKKLFKKNYRAYSHGCVRLEKPELLAQHLIDNYTDYKGDPLNIHTLIKSKKRNVIELAVNIPIHIQYLTCMGNEEGNLEFYSDIYNLDKIQTNGLFAKL